MPRHYATVVLVALLSLFATRKVESIDITLGTIVEILEFSRETVFGTLEALEWIDPGNTDEEGVALTMTKRMERRLMNQIAATARKIDRYQENMEQENKENLNTMLTYLPLSGRLDRNFHETVNLLNRIDYMYKDFLAYNTSVNYDRYTMEEFAKNCVSSMSGALPDLLQTIHQLVIPGEYEDFDNSLLILLAQCMREGQQQICNGKQSPQQLLYNLYNKIALTEMRGFAMMQFSYSFLQFNNTNRFLEEMKRTTSKYLERTGETLRAVKTAMSFAPRELWRCDPSAHKEDSTYVELKQLFQGYIVNEVDLNPTATCKENCGYYSFATVNGCYENQFCAKQRRCNGKVLNCQYIDSDMWICPSAKTSDRRYEYIEYENGLVYGNKGTCKRGTTKVDSWWRWLFWHCSYCMCFCDDHNSSSDRYFSLREVTSDVEKNRIITGLKFAKVNKIIHLVIQQGELLELGAINESTVDWKKVDNFTVLDKDVENGRDYHTLAWEKRAVDLDDLVATDNQLLTGVRFRLVGAHLNFEIRLTPFNFTSGKLVRPMEKSTWMSNDITDVRDPTAGGKARTELKLEKPGIPTRLHAPSRPDSRTNQYFNFAPTDLEKDAAQTTIPYIDVQPVVTSPAFLLSGAGLYHKGGKGSGGFLAPRVITYNFEKHLKADLPPQPSVLGVNEIPTL